MSGVGGSVSIPMTSFTAILEKEGDLYVALCPELDAASQGNSPEEATANLREAVELFLECAGPAEVPRGAFEVETRSADHGRSKRE